MRLLEYLLEHALAPDERTARGLILSGRVLVDDVPTTSAAAVVAEGANVRIRGDAVGYVSRGAGKLLPALRRGDIDPAGKVCLDLGVSTGGFTQVLLEQGASRIYAVDVGYGIVALPVRDDPRVVLLERTNARELTVDAVPQAIELCVGDLSFISWSAVLPAVRPLLAPRAELLLLLKPQFELPVELRKAALERGVVRLPEHRRAALMRLQDTLEAFGAVEDIIPSELAGAKGNREFFVYLQYGGERDASAAGPSYAELVERALSEVQE